MSASSGNITLLDRSPLLTKKGEEMIRRLREHPDAPRFNYIAGDRLRDEDVRAVEEFRQKLGAGRGRRSREVPEEIVRRVTALRTRVPYFRTHIPGDLKLEKDWTRLPTTSRLDLALRPWEFVPDDQELDRLIIYRTAGTTGHPISVPHHPVAIRYYEPMIELALAKHNARPDFSEDTVACFLVGSQIRTYTYATVLYNWRGAGFAKLNIRGTEWPHEQSQHRYFREMSPQFLSGDPISFSEMMRMGIQARPSALLTTSVALSPSLKRRLCERYKAPVIDWYSMVETGPIGYACPLGHGYHLLPHDIHFEVLGRDGSPAGAQERGEITVTGGRNCFFPLLRYRTGDFGRLDYEPCACGDAMPRILELEGRVPVLIRSSDGTPVTNVDLSRILRDFPLILHEFYQKADLSCELVARVLPDVSVNPAEIDKAMRACLGDLPLSIRFDPTLGDRTEGKAVPYRSELMLED